MHHAVEGSRFSVTVNPHHALASTGAPPLFPRDVQRTSHTLQEPTTIREAQRGLIITITHLKVGYEPFSKSELISRH